MNQTTSANEGKIVREVYESTLRDLFWQVAEDLGAPEASRIFTNLQTEFSTELAAFADEQGVIIQKPERVT